MYRAIVVFVVVCVFVIDFAGFDWLGRFSRPSCKRIRVVNTYLVLWSDRCTRVLSSGEINRPHVVVRCTKVLSSGGKFGAKSASCTYAALATLVRESREEEDKKCPKRRTRTAAP